MKKIVIELDDKTYQKSAEHDLLTVADLNKFIMAIGRGTLLSEYCDHCTGDKAETEDD